MEMSHTPYHHPCLMHPLWIFPCMNKFWSIRNNKNKTSRALKVNDVEITKRGSHGWEAIIILQIHCCKALYKALSPTTPPFVSMALKRLNIWIFNYDEMGLTWEGYLPIIKIMARSYPSHFFVSPYPSLHSSSPYLHGSPRVLLFSGVMDFLWFHSKRFYNEPLAIDRVIFIGGMKL